jgi:hypothetical protein
MLAFMFHCKTKKEANWQRRLQAWKINCTEWIAGGIIGNKK